MNLADINDAWNRRIKYLEEPPGEDIWQLPSETIALGTGDCEDIAMGKFFSVKWLLDKDPELVICKLRGQPHVVVVVDGWVLDNAAPEIVKLEARTDIETVTVCKQDDLKDPRFAYVVYKMDMVKELIDVQKFLGVWQG